MDASTPSHPGTSVRPWGPAPFECAEGIWCRGEAPDAPMLPLVIAGVGAGGKSIHY